MNENKNKLSYAEIEIILSALWDRANSEEEYGKRLLNSGDEEAAAPHYGEANECDRIAAKLRSFEF